MKDNCYSIGEVSALTGITTMTLRYYDTNGLISPEMRNPQNNYRYYNKDQVIKLFAVQRLRKLGCGRQMIKSVLEENSLQALYDQIELRIRQLEDEIDEREKLVGEGTTLYQQLKKSLDLQNSETGGSPAPVSEEIKIDEIPVVNIFSRKREISNYNVFETSLDFRSELYDSCRRAGLTMLGPEITTYYTEPLRQFTMQDCTVQIGIEVEEEADGKNIQRFGGFTAATTVHLGSYENMPSTHIQLLQWINCNGYSVDGYISEEFLASPLDILEQKNQVIRIIVPVKKKKTR